MRRQQKRHSPVAASGRSMIQKSPEKGGNVGIPGTGIVAEQKFHSVLVGLRLFNFGSMKWSAKYTVVRFENSKFISLFLS